LAIVAVPTVSLLVPARALADGRWFADADVFAADLDDATWTGAWAQAGGRIGSSINGQIDAGFGDIEGLDRKDLVLRAFYRSPRGAIIARYSFVELDVFESHELSVRGELFEDDIVTAVLYAGYENKNLDDDVRFGAVMLNVYPLDDLLVRSGLQLVDQLGEGVDFDNVDLSLGFEWQPGPLGDLGFSIFAEDAMGDVRRAGVRFYTGGAMPLVRRHREGAIQRLR